MTRTRVPLRAVLCALALFLAAATVSAASKAKYVFLFIGDGMAMPQITSAEIYGNAIKTKDVALGRLDFSGFPVAGLTTTYDASSFITDSASAGTAMASGNKTLSGVINMDPGKTKSFTTIAELAKAKGMKVGVVSSVSIDHATPASFYAKVPSRSDYYGIATQLVKSGFDYFGGGGFLQPTGKDGKQPDVVEMAKAAGYKYVDSAKGILALRTGEGKVIAVSDDLQDAMSMRYEIDRGPDSLSLAAFTRKGIELLENPAGFFMMVEGGKIDWACHANDAATSIKDVLAFDAAVDEAVKFASRYPEETLIVVTGDHETGGMTIGFAGTQYSTFFDKIAPQSYSFQRFNDEVFVPYKKATQAGKAKLSDMIPAIERCFGLVYDNLSAAQKADLQLAFANSMMGQIITPAQQDQYLLYGGYEPFTVKVTQVVNQTAGIGWTSYSHTGVPVATFARGVGQDLFGGFYDNTDIFRKLCAAAGIEAARN